MPREIDGWHKDLGIRMCAMKGSGYMKLLGKTLGVLIKLCYDLLGNYSLAIIFFTALTKVILLPVSLWTQRNSIKMVALTPELNQLKIKYYGDKDTIAEETQVLHKRVGYHPLASTIPLFIQLTLLIGVIGAVRTLLTGTESLLSVTPSEAGGIILLMPLAAGISAFVLGLAQNRLNPIQREQTKAGQWMTNGFSIAISLALGAFVPVGVGIYWIASNLFTILQQLILNAVVPPKKYIDYTALEESRRDLDKLSIPRKKVSKKDRKREKSDYKRFFSVANKHLAFYSEASGFYKYFQAVIEYLLSHSNIIIHYVTSDPKDQIFELAKEQPRIRPYYIGEKKLITLFMKLDVDIMVMTVPDLENFHLKRSYVRKDIEYIYMFHAMLNGMRAARPGALDHYDTVFTMGDYIDREIRKIEEITGVPPKKLVPCGYGVLDYLAAAYEKIPKETKQTLQALIAPSYQVENILESCLIPLVAALLRNHYAVTIRPHPQYLRRFPREFDRIREECEQAFPGAVQFETDFSGNASIYTADLLVTDWSQIGYEYALSTKKPVLFINTPMKVMNPQLAEAERASDEEPFDLLFRKIAGIALKPEEIPERADQAIQQLVEGNYAEVIETVRREHVYHFGESGKYGAQYILQALKARQENSQGCQ